MKIEFEKYHGAGNDFIIIDNRENVFSPSQERISKLCHPKYGIGADGLILIHKSDVSDFSMTYYNSDGLVGSMCGNGARCAVFFAFLSDICGEVTKFQAYDGIHEAFIHETKDNNSIVKLQMQDINIPPKIEDCIFLDTGSPHLVCFVENVDQIPVYETGREIRYQSKFNSIGGTNVNFVEISPIHIKVRTYERGVENETLSCGTGVTASALATALKTDFFKEMIPVHTKGGELKVYYNIEQNIFKNIWLEGPATFVFSGQVEI